MKANSAALKRLEDYWDTVATICWIEVAGSTLIEEHRREIFCTGSLFAIRLHAPRRRKIYLALTKRWADQPSKLFQISTLRSIGNEIETVSCKLMA